MEDQTFVMRDEDLDHELSLGLSREDAFERVNGQLRLVRAVYTS